MDDPKLIPFAVMFAFVILVVLVAATKFFPLMDMENRRREGLAYDDLLEKPPPGKLVWAVLILVPIALVIASWLLR